MDRCVYTDHWELEETHWWFVGRRAIIRALLRKILPGAQRIVDVGSGGGAMLPVLETYGSVASLEPDMLSAERLRQRFQSRFSVTTGSIDTSAFPELRPEVVTMFDVLEHIEDDDGALRRIFEVLPSGGRFICTVPAFPSLWSNHDVLSHHFRRYTRRDLTRKLAAAGFTIERMTFFNSLLFFPTVGLRWISRALGRTASDFQMPRLGMNRLLSAVFGSERWLVAVLDLPFGVSLFVSAKKP